LNPKSATLKDAATAKAKTASELSKEITLAKGADGTDYEANCDKNVYKHTPATSKDIKTVSEAAAAEWYRGNTAYDDKTGDMAKFDEKSKVLYENFARMMWKASTKAAFGMINPPGSDTVWVVGYYCYDKPVVTADGNDGKGEVNAKDRGERVANVRKNVGRSCFIDDYNDCYNRRARDRHNERRAAHEGHVPLELDTGIAKAIQKYLQSAGFTGAISSKDKGEYANCGENTFVLTDQTKLSQVPLTNMASDFWYDGQQYWDIQAGAPKAGATASQIA